VKPLTCASTRRRLQAFHDCELAVPDQIAVSAHLAWCDRCAELLDDLQSVGSMLQALAPGRAMLSRDDAGVFTSTVVSRMQAEEDASLFSTIRLMFEDLHLVYAGLGAATATAICLVIMLGMMRFATTDRPDSLAAVMTVLATPLECESGNDITDASGCRARWNERFARANFKNAKIVIFNDNTTIFDEILKGNADVMISESVETIVQQKLRPGLCAVNPDKPLQYGEMAWLLPRGDTVFKAWFDQWLHLAKASGEYDRIVARWLR